MNIQTKAAAYGIAGVALAGAVIFAGVSLGVINPASSGILSVMLTDPATVPKGVTAVFITYDNLGLHVSGPGDQWFVLGGHGTIETLGLVNFSQTISSANVPAFTYDQIAFQISSAEVEFNGVNYSATVNGGRLVASVPGGLTVNPSKVTAIVMDILPTVLNLGDRASPRLVIAAGVRALPVPPTAVTNSMTVLQSRLSLSGHAWSAPLTVVHSGNVTFSALSLNSNSFSFQATNHGSQAIDLRTVVVAPKSPGATAAAATDALSNSFVFIVESDGSLQIVHANDTSLASSVLGKSGYDLAPGASVHFSFSGAVTTVGGEVPVSHGTAYFVYVVGQAVPAQTVDAD